jgi:DNA-directed RNA polymerase specialized sigma24 family protein
VQGQLHTEPELLAELAAGGRKATEQIYSQYYTTITKWIQNNGGTGTDADDIYQEAIIILYEKAQGEDFRLSCRIGTYLFAISKHLWYKTAQATMINWIGLMKMM